MNNGSSEYKKKAKESANFDLIPFEIPSIDPSQDNKKEIEKKT